MHLIFFLKSKRLFVGLVLAGLICFSVYSAELVEVESLNIGIANAVVTVADTPTALPSTALSGRKVIIVQNIGSVTIYIGASTVSADETGTGGIQLKNDGDVFIADITDDIILYAIVASSTSPVAVLEIR